MNTKAIAITAAILAALLGVVAVAYVDDVDAAGESPESAIDLGTVQVGVGYVGTKEGAQFSAKISEQAYANESYKVVWTISTVQDDQTETWTFTYTKGGSIVSEQDNPDSPSISMVRGDMGYYTITMNSFLVETAGTTYTFQITSQITLDGKLELNTNYFKAIVITYNNVLANSSVVPLTVKTNVDSESITFSGTGKSISEGEFGNYIWYATGLPEGLNLIDGVISGMPVNVHADGKDAVLVVRGITGDDAGREYYGTLNIVVNDNNDSFTISITCDVENKLTGSNDSYVAVNGATLTLEINVAKFVGEATMIDATSGIRTDIRLNSEDNITKGTISDAGVGTYIVKVSWDGGSRDISLKVVPQTAGTSGAGFVVIGN